jgi:hypothetical protein
MLDRINVPGPRFSRALTPLAAVFIVACGSDPAAPPGPPPNISPTWSDAPTAPINVGQGQSISIPLTLKDPDAGDTPTATIDPAALAPDLEAEIDGTSIAVRAGYTLMGQTSFVVSLSDGRGDPVSIEVTLNVAPIRWLSTESWGATEGPEAREHGSFLVDTGKNRALLIGGSGYAPQGTALGDVWSYDLATSAWTMVTPTGDVPPPAGSRRAAQIPGTTMAYLFGGYGEAFAPSDELYRVTFDGEAPVFALIPQMGPPPARSLHMFTYDAETDRFFVFGGFGATVLGDTWMMKLEGDQAVWTKLSPATDPSPRYGFFYGVDEVNGRVILFSGAQGSQAINAADDTWVLDMRSEPPTWTLAAEGDAVPPGRRNGCAIFDPSGPRLFVFGGTSNGMTTEPGLFAFDARPGRSAWATLELADEPALRSSGMGFYDPLTGHTLLGFGNDAKLYRDLSTIGY